MGDGTVAGHCPASPSTVSRVMARHQLLESPLAPRSTAIPEKEIHRNGVKALALANIAISPLIRDGAGVIYQSLLNLSNRVHPDQLSGHSVRLLDLVLKLNLLNNLLLRDLAGLVGFGSRYSGQIMSMAMILLLIV